MSKMSACCGLTCSECPTFLATKSDDDEARRQTAAYYSDRFGFELKPEQINCDGCLSVGGRLIGYCKECMVRACCLEKGLSNCAECEVQPCPKLSAFHAFSPEAKEAFDALLFGKA